MSLAHLTDAERARLLRHICIALGFDYSGTSEMELLDAVKGMAERAARYDDLCR